MTGVQTCALPISAVAIHYAEYQCLMDPGRDAVLGRLSTRSGNEPAYADVLAMKHKPRNHAALRRFNNESTAFFISSQVSEAVFRGGTVAGVVACETAKTTYRSDRKSMAPWTQAREIWRNISTSKN